MFRLAVSAVASAIGVISTSISYDNERSPVGGVGILCMITVIHKRKHGKSEGFGFSYIIIIGDILKHSGDQFNRCL